MEKIYTDGLGDEIRVKTAMIDLDGTNLEEGIDVFRGDEYLGYVLGYFIPEDDSSDSSKKGLFDAIDNKFDTDLGSLITLPIIVDTGELGVGDTVGFHGREGEITDIDNGEVFVYFADIDDEEVIDIDELKEQNNL